MNSLRTKYLYRLEAWLKSAVNDLYVPPDRSDLECYGSGYNAWGVQTNQKAFSAFAVLGTDPDVNVQRTGMDKEEILERALRLLRFSLASHVTGDYRCLDGTSWGHTWISSLGLERMMHAVDALWSFMNDSDHASLRRVLLSECDWLVDCYHRNNPALAGQVRAGEVEDNHPENNLWNGVILHRTAMMYPDAPRTGEYLRQGTKFILNGISIKADAESSEIFAGSPLSDWHVGANFFPSFALNHHRYLNIGYMVICLSQVAMAHFSWKKRGLQAPAEFYHHVYDLWRLVKMATFPDGRLARIGGDTRVRYCYCQDYAIPVWLLMLDAFGESDCPEFERGWLSILDQEMAAGDGAAFIDARMSSMREISPTYYTRLESDRAAALSMALCWRRWFDDFAAVSPRPNPAPTIGNWSDDYHGATMVRGRRRLASWTWRAAQPPQGLCVPADRSDMAEWQYNLAARIIGTGARNTTEVTEHAQCLFDGGFVNSGICEMHSENHLAEGESDKVMARQSIAFAALPDDATVIVVQFAVAVNRAFIRSAKGLHLMIPNDIFNQGTRSYRHLNGLNQLVGPSKVKELIDLRSSWVNIDDCLTVIDLDGKSLKIFRPGERQIEIKDKPFTVSSLHADEICTVFRQGLRSCNPGKVIIDTAFALQVGESVDSARVSAQARSRVWREPGFRAAMLGGADGCTYLLAFNLNRKDGEFKLNFPARCQIHDLGGGEKTAPAAETANVCLAGNAAKLFRVEFC